MSKRVSLVVVGVLALVAVLALVYLFGDGEVADVEDLRGIERDPEGDAADTSTSDGASLRGSGRDQPEDLAPRKGHGAIEGVVLDETRAPAIGVLVQIEEEGEYWRPSLLEFDTAPVGVKEGVARVEARSDAGGRFRVEGLAYGARYRVSAHPPAGRHGSRTSAVPQPWATPRVVLLVGPGHELRGRVVDLAGRGTKAWVTATEPLSTDDTRRGAGTWMLDPVLTDVDGRFVLPGVPAGRILLGAYAPYARARNYVPVDVPTSEEVVLRLGEPGGAVIAGTIRDLEGSPVRGARICAVVTSFTGGHLKERTEAMDVTEAEGTFRLEGLLPGRVQQIHVDAEGYLAQPFLGHELRLEAGQTVTFDVTLARGRTLAGRVEDEAGEGVGGATVTLTPVAVPGAMPPRPATYEVTSDAAGRFRLDGLPLLPVDVTATCVGYAALPVERVPWDGASGAGVHETRDIVVRLTRIADAGHQIRGRALTSDGKPVPGTVVTALVGRDYVSPDGRRPSVTRPCAADGSFALDGLDACAWWRVMATAPGYSSSAVEALAAPPGAAAAEDVALLIEPRIAVVGRVVGPDGNPLAGMPVTAEADGQNPLAASTAYDGAFRLEGFASGETRTIYATDGLGGALSERVQATAGVDAPDVLLRVGEVHLLGGTVVDDAGRPVELKMVRLGAAGGSSGAQQFTYSDAAGRFLFRLFRPGEHVLSFGYDALPGTYATGRTDYVLVARGQEEGARAQRFVDVVLLDPQGRRVERGVVWFRTGDDRHGGRNSGSGARMGGGHFYTLLQASDPDFDLDVVAVVDAAGRRLDLAPLYVRDLDPDDSPFTFTLRPGGHVVGRVVDADGRGIPGVEVLVGPRLSAHELHMHGLGQRSPHSVRTDADGRFEQVGLAAGTVTVSVLAGEDYVAPELVETVVGGGEIVVVLDLAADLSGRVLDATGAGVANVELHAVLTKSSRAAWSDDPSRAPAYVQSGWRVRSGADGSFVLRGIPRTARLTVIVRPPAPWTQTTIADVGAGASLLEVRLQAGAFIEGEIVGEGWDAVGVLTLEAHAPRSPGSSSFRGAARASTRVAAGGGAFRLGPLEPGAYDLTVEGNRGIRDIVTLSGVGAPSAGLRVELPVARHVRGRILGEDLKGLRIAVHWADGGSTGTSTDGSGLFFFANTRVGPVTLVALEEEGDRYGLLEDVDPQDGPFKLTLRKGESIGGRVEGLPADFSGNFMVTANGPRAWKRTRGEADGSFRVDGLPPGTYEVDVQTGLPRGFFRLEDVSAGTLDLRLRYPR